MALQHLGARAEACQLDGRQLGMGWGLGLEVQGAALAGGGFQVDFVGVGTA